MAPRHITVQKRSVGREEPWELALPEESAVQLAERLIAAGTSPSRRLIRDELRQRVRAALEATSPRDREILVMRHLEEMSAAEIAASLGITEGAAKARHTRALERLRDLLGEDESGGASAMRNSLAHVAIASEGTDSVLDDLVEVLTAEAPGRRGGGSRRGRPAPPRVRRAAAPAAAGAGDDGGLRPLGTERD